MDSLAELDPLLTNEERGELASIAYFLARMEAIRARGLIASEAYATVAAETVARRDGIARGARYRTALATARGLAASRPREALEWADRARTIDPGRQDAFELAVHLLRRLGRYDESVSLCAEAAGRFPALQARLEELRARGGPSTAEALEEARAALQAGDDERVVALCAPLVDREENADVLALLAFATRRLGRLDEALSLYRRLMLLQPNNSVWPQWVRNIESSSPRGTRPAATLRPGGRAEPVSAAPAPPALSWSSIAGEFLEEHWQKLILSLAVLLIVVSSTVGAHMLLGPRLWSAVGKCALALVYTVMFAGFGAGLMRWGARRAGQMMLLTTLIVVPVNFMLAGEMKLLSEPSTSRVIVLALAVAALFLVTHRVASALGWHRGALFLATALVGLSACDAATARGVSFAWGYSAFLIPPWLFLGAVWWLNTRVWSDDDGEHREFVYAALGLLTFAFFSGLFRTAVVLRPPLHPSLFALPVMLTAIACVITAHHLAGFEKDPRRVMLMRFGGLVLSALAFALALARPPGPSPLSSGNTLATAMLGLALYAALLRESRQPAYLYLAFGALFLGYFGAFYFVVDLVRSVEHVAGRLMGYRQKLPFPFKSLNGVPFNVMLGLLSLHFTRRWRDDRLARHCHYLGVPFSIAACALSMFEAKAAVICLAAYAIVYAAAVPVFRQPRLVYLACASMAGALLFGSMLVPGVTIAAQAMGAAMLGLVFWGAGLLLRSRGVDRPYRIPLVHSGVMLAVLAMAGAGASVLPPAPAGPSAVAAFTLAALLCALALADLPRTPMAHATVAGALGAALSGFELATHHAVRTPGPFGVVIALVALAVLAACEWASRRNTVRSAVIAGALPNAVVLLVVLSISLAAFGLRPEPLAASLTLAMGALGLLGTTRYRRELPLVYAGLGLALGSVLALCRWLLGPADLGVELAALALAAAMSALALWGVGTVLRRRGAGDFYTVPCFKTALAVTVVVFVLALVARADSRGAFPMSATALVLNAVFYVLLTSAWSVPALTYASVASFVSATYLTLFSVGDGDPAKAYILGLAGVVEGLIFWGVARLCERSRNADHARVYGRPLDVSALALTVLALPPALGSRVTMALASVAFLLMIRSFPSSIWLYPAMGALGRLLELAWFQHFTTVQWMMAAVVGSFALWGAGTAARRAGPRLCRRLGIPTLALEYPFFNVAVASGALALVCRLGLSVADGAAWPAHAWLPLCVALFCLLMVEAYPGRGWIHGFAALASIGLAMAAAPVVSVPAGWLLAAMILTMIWLGLGRMLSRVEPALGPWLGLERIAAGAVLEAWSIALFALAMVPSAIVVVAATLDAVFSGQSVAALSDAAGWPFIAMTLAMAWVYALAQGVHVGEDRVIGSYTVQTLLVWWLGLSPWLAGRGVVPQVYEPLASAALALAIVLLESRGNVGIDVSARRLTLAHGFVVLLALVAAAFTRGEPTTTTIGTLLLLAAALGYQAIARHHLASGYAGGIAWCALCSFAVHVLVRPRLLGATTPAALDFALGTIVAVYGLSGLTAWLRRTTYTLKAWGAKSRGDVVLALEWVSVVGALASATAVGLIAVEQHRLGGFEVAMGIGVLVAVAVLSVVFARRWQSEWLVYAAQAALLGAYFNYRGAAAPSFATDAFVLTLFGYLDLGLSEVMQRLRMNLYARPTLYVSLVLPLIPLMMAVFEGRLDDLSLFLMLTTAAFYAVACYTRQWKSLGYASAVLLNAMLWLAWSREGWRLAEYPQFYFVPVGLSAILFAEVNRRELGNEAVNAIRGIGLSTVYLSLALPIWQAESLGAWLTLLLLSLAGIMAGIGLRSQSFLWLGLIVFVLDVVYQLGRMSAENALARWAIMLSLGILLILFVALNEKKRIVATMREYYQQARQWE